MADQAQASVLAQEGFELWQNGRLDEAAEKYRQALDLADPNHLNLDAYHGEYAAVLATLGRHELAREHYELAVGCALRVAEVADDTGVAVARYFLSEHLLETAQIDQALAVVEEGIASNPKPEWLLRYVQARALWVLGRSDDARAAAETALKLSPTSEKRAELRERLGYIFDSSAG